MIAPSFTDSALIHYGARATYDSLLEGGVQIYEREDALMHAKTAVIDGVWSTVGSANIDQRSFVHNNELNAAVVSADLAREMEAMFRRPLGPESTASSLGSAGWARASRALAPRRRSGGCRASSS